jgi:hypothetical protein
MFITIAGLQRKWIGYILLLMFLCWIPSCGGGGSAGGGGGVGMPYSIVVKVTSGSNNKTAGTITLTVK